MTSVGNWQGRETQVEFVEAKKWTRCVNIAPHGSPLRPGISVLAILHPTPQS